MKYENFGKVKDLCDSIKRFEGELQTANMMLDEADGDKVCTITVGGRTLWIHFNLAKTTLEEYIKHYSDRVESLKKDLEKL